MDKAGPLEVAPHAHLHLHGTQRIKDKAEHLQHNHRQIPDDEGLEALQRFLFDKVVHRVPLEQRQQHIDNRDDDVGDDNQ